MTPYVAACVYALCAALPISMQIALVFGAPLGRFANGGKFPGVLPPVWRGLAVVQGGLLVAMSGAVLAKGGVVTADVPKVVFWGAVVLSALTMIANLISPSRPERLLWSPVTIIMFVASLGVAFL